MSDRHVIRLECLKLVWPQGIANPDLAMITARAETVFAWVTAADTSQEPAKIPVPRKRPAQARTPA